MRTLLRGGRVLDPASGLDATRDVLMEGDRILEVGDALAAGPGAAVVDARGRWVLPGLVDLHVHLREPGQEGKETIRTGGQAAACGGVTTLLAMPNTTPVIDRPHLVRYVLERAARECAVRVLTTGSVTLEGRGEELSDFMGMKAAGMAALSDDPFTVMNADVMRRAMQYAATCGLMVATHCEDKTMAVLGQMHEGAVATCLGLHGLPAVAEELIVARNILLAEETGCRVHICHVSTDRSVELIREGKRRGVAVTAEVTPHHLVLTDEAVSGYRTEAKMNPPLRPQGHVEALRRGLKDGTLDAIATDHAPHTSEEKDGDEFGAAPFGVVGLETSLAVVLTELVHPGFLTPLECVDRMSAAPARILGAPAGRLAAGRPADVILVDPEEVWAVEARQFASKGRHTPFEGRRLKGRVKKTWVGGALVFDE